MPTEGRDDADEIAQLLDLVGRRWMPRILYELHRGAIGFRELRRRCASMSSSVLTQRLSELRSAGLAAPDDFGAWELTDIGAVLAARLRGAIEATASAAEGPEPAGG